MRAFATVALIAVASILGACAQLPKDYPVEPSTAISGTKDTGLGLRSLAERQGNLEQTRLIPILDGVDAFYARVALANSAERSLDVQYFLWHKDLTGQILLKFLLEAADRGVRVRMLLDDLDNQALDREFYALDTHPNISIRLFNPFATRGFKYVDFLNDSRRLKRRMHNKSFTADNQYTIIGGRNIGDEYFDAKEDSNFYDFDAVATGPIVQQVSAEFDRYWNHELAVPVYAFDHNTASAEDLEDVRKELAAFRQSHMDSRYANDARDAEIADALRGEMFPAFTGEAQAIFDDPDKGLGLPREQYVSMQDHLRPHLEKLERELILISPYFVPTGGMAEWLVGEVERGIDVGVITNSYHSTDTALVHAAYSRYRKQLLAGGVNLYELKPSSRKDRQSSVAFDSEASLHSKVFIFDRKTVFIGSLNLDPFSLNINTEMGILFHSPELAAQMVKGLDKSGLQNVYELELVKSPPESKGEFTVYTWNVEWIERVDGEVVRHNSEPGVGVWERIKLFFQGLVPESLT